MHRIFFYEHQNNSGRLPADRFRPQQISLENGFKVDGSVMEVLMRSSEGFWEMELRIEVEDVQRLLIPHPNQT
jgi:hypothetical protein